MGGGGGGGLTHAHPKNTKQTENVLNDIDFKTGLSHHGQSPHRSGPPGPNITATNGPLGSISRLVHR